MKRVRLFAHGRILHHWILLFCLRLAMAVPLYYLFFGGGWMGKTKGIKSGFGWAQGNYSLPPHVNIPPQSYEEEHGRQGFYGRASHLYHRHPPTGWLRIEGPLRPHAYQANQLIGEDFAQPQIFLKNSDVQLGIAKLKSEMMVFARNGDGDEVRFVHEGSGRLETDYG